MNPNQKENKNEERLTIVNVRTKDGTIVTIARNPDGSIAYVETEWSVGDND